MDYQLVLQFRGDDCPDFDVLVELEEELQACVEPIADVDGHDMGSGEVNIFMLTADPIAAFERIRPLLSDASLLNKVGVAYRKVHSDDYKVIWPVGRTEGFVVA